MSRDEHKARTAEKVKDAARFLFKQRGYEAVTIRDVAAAAELSTGAVFSSFAGKAEVFAAAMGRPAPTASHVAEFLGSVLRDGSDAWAEQISALRAALVGEEA